MYTGANLTLKELQFSAMRRMAGARLYNDAWINVSRTFIGISLILCVERRLS